LLYTAVTRASGRVSLWAAGGLPALTRGVNAAAAR